jgi:hypothetical protein
MRVAWCLFVIALGAILVFAVNGHLASINLTAVGVILMIVGALGLVITIYLQTSRRRTDVIRGRNGTTVIEPTRYDPTA